MITDFCGSIWFGSWLKQFPSRLIETDQQMDPERFLKLCFICADNSHDVFMFCSSLQFHGPASEHASEISTIQMPRIPKGSG